MQPPVLHIFITRADNWGIKTQVRHMKDGWMITLTVRMRVRGAGSRHEAVWSATQHLEEAIRNSAEITYSADAKRISPLDEEPVFGKQWE